MPRLTARINTDTPPLERYTWSSQVLRATDGSYHRWARREQPRLEYEVQVTVAGAFNIAAFMVDLAAVEPWVVPLVQHAGTARFPLAPWRAYVSDGVLLVPPIVDGVQVPPDDYTLAIPAAYAWLVGYNIVEQSATVATIDMRFLLDTQAYANYAYTAATPTASRAVDRSRSSSDTLEMLDLGGRVAIDAAFSMPAESIRAGFNLRGSDISTYLAAIHTARGRANACTIPGVGMAYLPDVVEIAYATPTLAMSSVTLEPVYA